MRAFAAALLLLASCGPSQQDEINAYNQHMAEANALLAPEMPRGWRYNVRPDRIRNRVDRLASLANEDDDPLRDQTLILSIQQDGDEPPGIFFRGHNAMLGCATVCGVEFRSGETVGTWPAERTYGGDAVMLLYPADALPVIRSARSLIVEVDSDIGGQHTFNPAGLTWPPAASSR
jgi:hypothetical protein